MIGLSWLGVPTTASPEPSWTSHAQPEPNWPDAGLLHLGLEVVERAEGRVDRLGQRPVGLAAAVGRHRLPEEGVVEMAAAVVADGAALVVGKVREVGDHLLDRLVGPLGALERSVGLVHVGLVVLVVVHLHRCLVDVGLERVVSVGKVRYLVRHGSPFVLCPRLYCRAEVGSDRGARLRDGARHGRLRVGRTAGTRDRGAGLGRDRSGRLGRGIGAGGAGAGVSWRMGVTYPARTLGMRRV